MNKKMTDHEHKVRFPPLDNITDGVGQRQRFYRVLVSKSSLGFKVFCD